MSYLKTESMKKHVCCFECFWVLGHTSGVYFDQNGFPKNPFGSPKLRCKLQVPATRLQGGSSYSQSPPEEGFRV